MKVRISWNEINSKKNVSRKFKRLDVSSLEELITTIMGYETACDKCCVTVKIDIPEDIIKAYNAHKQYSLYLSRNGNGKEG